MAVARAAATGRCWATVIMMFYAADGTGDHKATVFDFQ